MDREACSRAARGCGWRDSLSKQHFPRANRDDYRNMNRRVKLLTLQAIPRANNYGDQ
jgi:hypothetical protein